MNYNLILICLVFAFFLFLILAGIYLWLSFRRKKELSAGLRQLTSADFPVRFALPRKKHSAQLFNLFNRIADRINELFFQLKEEKEVVETTISHSSEAIAFLSKDGRVITANKNFCRLLSSSNIKGRYFWEVLRSSSFRNLFSQHQETKKTVKGEIQLADKSFIASIASLSSGGKIVVHLRDITQEKELEKIKKELVSNIIHELRTPLTAIKGFVETLKNEEVTDRARHYLEIIKKNADRLDRIIEDLLILSELENKKDMLEKEPVNVEEIIPRVVDHLQALAAQKKLSLKMEIENNLPLILGDSFRLEQMLINLVDNAIKYTDKGGVTIKAWRGEKELLLAVEDTGMGIPEKHLSRIFERFYVGDKSRSRRYGGTGLGLAIVKHIVLLHGGKISVRSREGEGTVFTVSLPLYAR